MRWKKLLPVGAFMLAAGAACGQSLVSPSLPAAYVDKFNQTDRELRATDIANSQAAQFLTDNIPLFECPDKQLEETYYFRWWTYRKHLRQTPEGYVVTEFLPNVPWAGKYNTISCAAAHHFYEGRWLRDPRPLADYARFWLTGSGRPRAYSFWAADAIYHWHLVHPDPALLAALYPALKENFAQWEAERRDDSRLFWQSDDRDGMEQSVSGALAAGGKGYRVTINSYMYGEAAALSQIAALLDKPDEAAAYRRTADELQTLINTRLWDEAARFYKVIPLNGKQAFSPARELHGYTPWYFGLAPDAYADAWLQLLDKKGFYAAFGPTTVEQRAAGFKISYEGHECQWNGPSWPYATAVTLTGLARLLNHHPSPPLSAADYLGLLQQYSRSHRLQREDGSTVPWIDENLNPHTGDWISRTRLKTWKNNTWDTGKGGEERGKDYNHSTFCDLIISGLVGVRPQAGSQVIINPLVPENTWDYFCLDNITCKGHRLTVVYDKHGDHYGQGRGLMVFVDGTLQGKLDRLGKLSVSLQ